MLISKSDEEFGSSKTILKVQVLGKKQYNRSI